MIQIEIKEDDIVTILLLLKEHGERQLWESIRNQMWEFIEQTR